MPTVLITGANRGLGLEMTRQYLAAGWRVVACCRAPGDATQLRAVAGAHGALSLEALDVADLERIDALAEKLRGVPVDVLVNNAGLFGPKPGADDDPRQTFGRIDADLWVEVLRVNTIAPVRMAEAFLDHVAGSAQQKIVAVSSSLGSIGDSEGGFYHYRTSKAALNMAMANLAKDLRPRGIWVGIYCPGWVRTDMGGPRADISPEESVAGLRSRIAELGPDTTGRFLRYDGEPVAW